jgi:hypothetical protein
MNIVIMERLRKANDDSVLILNSTVEQSLKRRQQLENYPKTENGGIISRLITAIKSRLHL